MALKLRVYPLKSELLMRLMLLHIFLWVVFTGLTPWGFSTAIADDVVDQVAADGILTVEEAKDLVSEINDPDSDLLTQDEIAAIVERLESENWAQETTAVEPAVPVGEGESLQIRIGRQRVIDLSFPTEGHDAYLALNISERSRFLARRRQFLAAAATVLNSTRMFYGVGTLVRSQIRQVFKRGSVSRDPLNELGRAVTDRPTHLSELRWWAIQTAIRNLDQTLFQNARIVSNQNEFSVSASLAVIGEAGVGQRGMGGSLGLGISFGFNVLKKAVVFEIFSEVERLDRALTPTAQIGLIPRVGLNVYNQISGKEMSSRRGQTVYPPLSYVSATPDLWAMGATTSLMAFPPILPEFMVYTHRIVRKSLLRIMVSPVMPGWLRVNLGRWPRKAQWTLESVAPVAEAIQSPNWESVLGLTCESLFTF